MNPTPLQQLVQQILDIAMRIAECGGPAVRVEYRTVCNQLHVIASQPWSKSPVIDECIQLYTPDELPLQKKRVDQRLRCVMTQLNGLLLSSTIPPRPAA